MRRRQTTNLGTDDPTRARPTGGRAARFLALALAPAVPVLAAAAALAGSAGEPVRFNRDIRPILSDACYNCHGPDSGKRQAGLRLDTEAGAFAVRGGRRIIVQGSAAKSPLFRRVSAAEERHRMPPAGAARALSPREIELLRRWLDQGAPWEKHWSFLPPVRPPLPQVRNRRWVRNPIDAFVLQRLEREGLSPSPEADRATLIRRVTLDLTGLPPTPAEVDAFIRECEAERKTDHGDTETRSPNGAGTGKGEKGKPAGRYHSPLTTHQPDAYERLVDRLLASPRFGERMAIRWLEAARYADTNGYQSDGERFMWRWRDWVIDAFNRNMPFDRFTVEQLAGDLLPRATLDQRIATGFNRNHRGNGEGGIIPEEYAAEYVVDRVDTTATVWLGLTLGCARCHDHKYDPFRQKEFYQLYAFFNNIPEKGRANKYGNSPPMIPAPTPAQQAQLRDLDTRLSTAERELATLGPARAAAQAAWEKSLPAGPPGDGPVSEGLASHFPLDGDASDRARPGNAGSTAGRFLEGEPVFQPDARRYGARFDGRRFLDAGNVGDFGFYDRFSAAAWVYPAGDGTILSRMTDVPRGDGYGMVLRAGKVQVNLVKRWLDDALRVETVRALEAGRWQHVLMTYDGSRVGTGVRVYVDGRPEKLTVLLDELNQSFQTTEPLRIGAGGGAESRFRGLLDEVRIYNRVLTPAEAEILAAPETAPEITAVSLGERSPQQARTIGAWFLATAAPEPIRRVRERILALRKERERLVDSLPTTMVMEELPAPRATHVLIRGAYDRPGEKVSPGVPASLPPLPGALGATRRDRLALARWVVDAKNPLTARVAVNRFWQMLFGTGLVKTVEDFGSQGEWPSHPELLDWLAVSFAQGSGFRVQGSGSEPRTPNAERLNAGSPKPRTLNPEPWNVKALLRLIVTSAAYRQASRVTPALLQKDPENRLLARGPRLRLPAEMVRDQVLAISGLLVEKIGGPSVKPYQPAGLWQELGGGDGYKPDQGDALYRRSLYTFWKRTVAPPQMVTFDAAGREACVVRETRTNTPLQALTLMNDVTYVEAARVLAQRIMKEAGAAPGALWATRLTLAFRLATARRPRPAELQVLLDGFRHHLDEYRRDRAAALRLVSAGEAPRDPALDVAELAALTAVAGMILNLDETITKE